MELRKRLNPRIVFIVVYVVLFLAYIIYGLQPAEAAHSYEVATELKIPSIGLVVDVTKLDLVGNELKTPDTIAGSYTQAENKTLLIGHSTTAFSHLDGVKIGDELEYNGQEYKIVRATLAVKEVIDMDELLAPAEEDTLMIMTCAGTLLGGGDATHRLIVTAIR